MPRDFAKKIAALNIIPKRLLNVLGNYLFFLTLHHNRHSLEMAAELSELDASRFSAALSKPETYPLARQLFKQVRNRAIKQFLKKAKGRICVIIDATFQKRQSQQLENVHRYHTGTGFVTAHKFINVLLVDAKGNQLPLDTYAHFTKKYCAEHKIAYLSEFEIVAQWIEQLPLNQLLLNQTNLERCMFLLDAGYDTKRIQKAILALGAHFVASIKSSRSVSGWSVAKYFYRHRYLPYQTIRLMTGSGSKRHRRSYCIRSARHVQLKGVGQVHVLWSKAIGHARKPKYLAASDLSLNEREIVQWYAKRWVIESWHRHMKQNHGYVDCHCRAFSAVYAHLQFCLTAYILNQERKKPPKTLTAHLKEKELIKIRNQLTKAGAVKIIKNLIQEAFLKAAA